MHNERRHPAKRARSCATRNLVPLPNCMGEHGFAPYTPPLPIVTVGRGIDLSEEPRYNKIINDMLCEILRGREGEEHGKH